MDAGVLLLGLILVHILALTERRDEKKRGTNVSNREKKGMNRAVAR